MIGFLWYYALKILSAIFGQENTFNLKTNGQILIHFYAVIYSLFGSVRRIKVAIFIYTLIQGPYTKHAHHKNIT